MLSHLREASIRCEVAIGPANGVDVPVTKLLGNDDERRPALHELAGIGMAQSMKAESIRQARVEHRALEGVTIVCEPAPPTIAHKQQI